MTTPADWYPDPEVPDQLRYWDGANWTEHRAPGPAAEPVPPAYASQSLPAWSAPPPNWPEQTPTGSSGGPNKKLVIGLLGGAAALIIVLAVALVYVFVIRDDDSIVVAAPSSTSTSSATTRSTTPNENPPATDSTTPAPAGAQGSDGAFTFAITSTESGTTINSTENGAVQTAADGIYYVVHLSMTNTGTSQQTFVAMFQTLDAAGQTFTPDDAATALLGGTVAVVDPGAQAETTLVFDVPEGTQPDSILVKADPSTPGVTLPLQ